MDNETSQESVLQDTLPCLDLQLMGKCTTTHWDWSHHVSLVDKTLDSTNAPIINKEPCKKKMPFKQAIEIGSKPTRDPNQNLNMYKSLKRLQIYLPASNQIPALMHNKHVLENETLRQVQCQWLFVVEMLVWIKKCRQYKSPLHNDNHAKSVEPLDQQSAPPKVKASATPQNLLQHIASLFMMNSMICNIMFQWLAGLNPCHPKPCLVSMFAQQ